MEKCDQCEFWKRNKTMQLGSSKWGKCSNGLDDFLDFDIDCACDNVNKVEVETIQYFGCRFFEEKEGG